MNPSFQPRSMLFVSGEKSERFDKAFAAGADLVCIDLEDAVHPQRKAQARGQALAWLAARAAAPGQPKSALRLNGLHTLDGLRDVLALADSPLEIDLLLLPKTESPADVRALQAWVGPRVRHGIVALIETPAGIERAAEIGAAPGLLALMLGGADLSAELGAAFDRGGLAHARGRLVNAAKANGLQAWDVPHIDLADAAALADETRHVLALGFDCKTAIHPQQIATIHAAFAPGPAELDWARSLLAALPPGGSTGAFLFNGRMVDAPVLKKARRIVARAALKP